MKYFAMPREDRRLDESSRPTLRGSFLELSDGITHYDLAGPSGAETVVLVGGLTTPLFYWDGMARELHAQGLRSLAFSGYGRGYSDRVHARYDEQLFVRQLYELTKQLQLASPLHLVGTSMGALTVMAFAARHRSSVASMTLIAPAGLDRPPLIYHAMRNSCSASVVAKRLGNRILLGHLDKEVLRPEHEADLATMLEDSFRFEGSVFAVFDTLQHFPLFNRSKRFLEVGALKIPTCLIWGKDDRVTPIARLEKARSLLCPTECHVITLCGHMPPFEQPREVATHIVAFLETHGVRRN